MNRSSTTASDSASASGSDSESLLTMTPTAAPALAPRDVSEDADLFAAFDRYIASPPVEAAPPLAGLAARHPACDKDVLRAVLASVNDDVPAAEALLRDAPLAPVDVAADAAIAGRLQQIESRRARARTRPEQAPPADAPPAHAAEGDAALAARLHRLEMRRAAEQAPRHRRNDAAVTVNPLVMEDMVDTLREIVVPALRAHFEELVLPDTKDTSVGVEYELQRFQVSNLSLPPENIHVKPTTDGKLIRVSVVNTFLELEVGRWSYESKGFVPVKDAGTARVSVNGMSISVMLEPRWSHGGGTKVVIADCVVTIDGKVRFATEGAVADWAYKAITVVLKPLVVSYIKEAIADTVSKTLAFHLSQWAFSRSLDDQPARAQRTEPQRPSTPQSTVTAAE